MNIEVIRQNKNVIVSIEFQTGDRSFASVSCYSTGAQVDLFLAPEDLHSLRDAIQGYLDTQEAPNA